MAVRLKFIAALFLLFVVVGCAAGRQGVDATPFALPEKYAAAQGCTLCPVVQESGQWWKGFGDGRLNQLMESAFAGNLDIAIAYERVEKARAAMGVVRGAQGPQVNLSGNKGRSKFFGVTDEKYNSSVAASYELDLWGRLSASTKAARRDMEATEFDLKALYISVSAELADQYYIAVERNLQLEIDRLMVRTATERLSLNEERYGEGLVSARDLFIAREGVAVAAARSASIEAERARAFHAVAILTGGVPGAEVDGLNALQPAPPAVPPLLPSRLLLRRPDLQAALKRVEASNSRVGAAIADRFPVFSLTGDYGEASASLGSLVSSPNVFWSLLLQVTAPVLDGGRRKAEVAKREAAFNESLIEYRKAVLTALKDVEGALVENRAAVVALPLAVDRVAAARGALAVATDRYRNGVGDYIDVLAERQRLYEAMSGLVGARRQLISARIGVVRSLGGDFMDKLVTERAGG